MFKKKVIEIISNSLNEKIKILEKELKQINYKKTTRLKAVREISMRLQDLQCK